ncbi:theronine dehydrogenase [Tricholoma matsutake]|nr:theronine dehydrogenase [Tricholoma matsutake 945]
MKAVRYYGPQDIRIENIAEPIAKDGQVKIKVMCGTDLAAFLAPAVRFPTLTVPNELTGETLPITMGHEFSGVIVDAGPGVDVMKWGIGKNAIVEPIISCMKDSCHACSSGHRNICPSANYIGICGWGGGLAEYITIDVRFVHILPEGIPLEVGACIEPLAVAWHAVERSGYKAGQSALIIGAGPIGLFLLKVLKSIDPFATIIASEPTTLRRRIARVHGATYALDPAQVNVHEAVLQITSGIGVDIAFDAAGVQTSIDTAVACVRARGTAVNVAIWGDSPKVEMNPLVLKEITLIGSIAYDGIHPEVLIAVAAKKIVGIEDLITSKIAIEDIIEKGFQALLNDKSSQVVKILVHP